MKVELINYTKQGIFDIALMARATRVNSLEELKDGPFESDEDFVKELMGYGHMGILEHINFTFHVREISRVTSHQLVRHRIASYLQMSARHTKPIENHYVMPPSIKNKDCDCEFEVAIIDAFDTYTNLVKKGVPIEDARYILPPAFFTHISLTMNCRELRHFFKLRCDKHAQWEIREMANLMLDICREKYPILFEDL